MSTATPVAAVAATDPAPVPVETAPLPVPAAAAGLGVRPIPVSEGAVVNRVVVLLTPFLTIGAAWVAGVVSRHVPGVKLDQTQVTSVMVAIVVVCLGALWKWLQGWQQHEALVAQGLAAPIKPVLGPVATQR